MKHSWVAIVLAGWLVLGLFGCGGGGGNDSVTAPNEGSGSSISRGPTPVATPTAEEAPGEDPDCDEDDPCR